MVLQYINQCWPKPGKRRRMIKLLKLVGSGGLSLETMEVAAVPTLQRVVLEKMDIDDVFLKAHRNKVMAATEHLHVPLSPLEILLGGGCSFVPRAMA